MFTLKNILLHILLLLIANYSFANQKPYVTNITRDKYHAASKNWSIGQDERGFMYFGNDIGLLEFDGIGWKLNQIPSTPIVRALTVESHNTIYTGGLNEFGRWDRDYSGSLQYTSLKNLLPPKSMNNESIWRIWIDGDNVYFQSFTNIYVYNKDKIQQLTSPKGFMLLLKIKDEYWVQEMRGGLFKLKDGELKAIQGSEFLNGTITRVILPYEKDCYLIGTSTGQLYLYDKKNLKPWNQNLSLKLKGQELNCGLYCSKRNTYYLGTQLSGIYEVDTEGNILNHFNATNSLQNNTILSLYEDNNNNIWVAMDRGLSYIRYTAGLSYYRSVDGTSSSVYTTTLWNNYLLVGTNQGIYYAPKEKLNDLEMYSSLKFLEGSQGQVWSFSQIDGKLFCCHNNGLFEITPDFKLNKNQQINSGVFKILKTSINKNNIDIIITYKDLYIINKENGKTDIIQQITDHIYDVEVDNLGNIWLETIDRGIYKCQLNDEMSAFRYCIYYGQETDPTLPKHLQVFKASGRVFFLGNGHFYAYNESKDNLQPTPLLDQCFENINNIKRIVPINNEESWALTKSSVYRFFYDGYTSHIKEGYKVDVDNLSLVTASENISVLNDSLSVICLDDGFILHNSRESRSKEIKTTPPNIEYIHINGNANSVLTNSDKSIQIPYEGNTVTIGFSINNAFAQNLFVEYKLEGVDKDWSQPIRKSEISYDRLPQGKYTLYLRSTDELNNYSDETIVNFEILPPWYKTIWWYLICFLLTIFILYVVFLFTKRRLIHKHLLNTNKQLQNEIEEKNAEMLTQTSFIVRKNELILKLKEIVDEICSKNTQKGLIPLYQKINYLLANNLDTEDDWKMFLIKFEQKHHNFFKILKKKYPLLTNNDLRLCACLKLNMDTKDIASLMNLSVRAIENNRYRLRKKLDLVPSQNLNEFFLDIE